MKHVAEARRYAVLRRRIDRYLHTVMKKRPRSTARELWDACRYVVETGGKRVRSTLVLLSCGSVGGRVESAVHAGAAVELMHNFTLVHDDIMDKAPSRRGNPTVHVKWNLNNALLVGDVLLGLGYTCLLSTSSRNIQRIAQSYTTGLLEVCEGQALDMEFEQRDDVTLREYMQMIGKKTGGLIAMATELGGLLGGGTPRQVHALRDFGAHLGRAFQIQDDLLDVVAEEEKLGKAIGGDIVVGKRTFLLLTALERASGRDREVLEAVLRHGTETDPATRAIDVTTGERSRVVEAVTDIYRRHGVIDEAVRHIERSTARATAALDLLPRNASTRMLRWFSELLVKRAS